MASTGRLGIDELVNSQRSTAQVVHYLSALYIITAEVGPINYGRAILFED
jgi:hypothetical protein